MYSSHSICLPGADLCLHNNKLVSGTHCFIEKDELGQVWVQDCSTNGTLLNLTEKLVGKVCTDKT